MGRARKLLIPAIAAAAGLAVLLKLGFWQLDRLAWKDGLIASVEQNVTAAPQPAPPPGEWNSLQEQDFADYRHVSVSGRFLPGTAYYYLALSNARGAHDGPGYFVYSPFETSGGWRVMINRGFVPQGLSAGDLERIEAVPEGDAVLTGLLRMGEAPNWTTPEPDLEKRIWFARDTDRIGEVLGAGPQDLAPYSIDLDLEFTPASGLPQAGETIVRFKNDHLGYALTWFGLAATLAGVFFAYAATIMWPRKQETAD